MVPPKLPLVKAEAGERGSGSTGSLAPSPAAWAVFVTLPLLVMAYSLWKSPLWWTIPRDPTDWDAAQYAAHGQFGWIYSPVTNLVSFPGYAYLSIPVAALSNLFHLGSLARGSEGTLHPTAWYLWGPWVALTGGSIVLAVDSVASFLGVSQGRRAVLAIVEGILVWQLLALFTHPEDALAVSLFLWAWLASQRGRWTVAGWLMGAAIAVQPVVLLVLPILFVCSPARGRLALVVRSAVPSVVLLLPELVTDFGRTTTALLKQPNFPTLDHPTPLLFMAPHLGLIVKTPTVAAGPARLISLALCCLVAYAIHRRPQSPVRLVWCFALCFAFRSMVESVMDPYYLWPALALAVLAAASTRWLYFTLATLASILMTGYAQSQHTPWVWWGPLVVGMGIVLCAAFPVRSAATPVEEPADVEGSSDVAPSTLAG